jgi:Ca-activated chloride channel family protein
MRLAFLAAAAFGVPLLAAAQTATEQPVFPIDLDVINLTVTVHDKAGGLVSDLVSDDFLIYEDGRQQKISVFGRAIEPEDDASDAKQNERLALDLGLLLDTSESMLKELKLSKEAALRFLDAVPRARDLLTIFFDQDIRISRYDSENQQGLIERIVEAKGGGNTALYDAVAVYLSRVGDAKGRKVLVLFTDGEDSTSALGMGEVLDLVRSSSVTIYSIAFSGGFPIGSNRAISAKSFLARLSELTGGAVFTPRSGRDLSGIYDTILDELGAQYVLGFSSDNLKRDGKIRKLRVAIKKPGLTIRHRTSYVAPKD